MAETIEFELPAEIGAATVDDVHEEMIADAPNDLDKAEGGVFWDFTRPTAVAVAEGKSFDLSYGIQCIFPMFADGEFLDLHGKSKSLPRKQAFPAYVEESFYGAEGTAIPKGFVVTTEATETDDAIEFVTIEAATIPADGYVNITCMSNLAGIAANVIAGSITVIPAPLDGLVSVENLSGASGGADIESDDDYRARLMEYDENQGLSFVGNDADYKRWAEEVDGVGKAVIIPAQDDSGYVYIILTDANGDVASDELCQSVYDHIMSEMDRQKRLAPVNALLKVQSALYLNIDISATVELEDGYTVEMLKEPFLTNLKAVYKEAIDLKEVRLSKIYGVFEKTSGFKDYGDVMLNGDAQNIVIDIGTIPHTESSNLTFTIGDIPDDSGKM